MSIPQTSGRKLPPIRKQSEQTNISFENDDPSEINKPRIKKKKEPKSIEENPRTIEKDDATKQKKRKKRRSIKDRNLELDSDLEDVLDDIENVKSASRLNTLKPYTFDELQSPPTNLIHIEKKDKFVASTKEDIEYNKKEKEKIMKEQTADMTIFAIQFHKRFLRVSLFMQGLLAGICLFQIIVSYILFYSNYINFLTNYSYIAEPVQCLLAFLFIFSLVSTIDRYYPFADNEMQPNFLENIQLGSISIVIYFVGLIFSLSTAYADESIFLYSMDPSNFNSTNIGSVDTYLYNWQVLNLIRGLMAIIGWIVIALLPQTDRLSRIIAGKKYFEEA